MNILRAQAKFLRVHCRTIKSNHHRKRSYGKGLVQNLYVLSDSVTALKLTTQRYYTPSGKCIQRPFEDGTEAYFNDQKIAMKIDGETPAIYKNNEWGIHPDIYYAEDTLFPTGYLQNYFIVPISISLQIIITHIIEMNLKLIKM